MIIKIGPVRHTHVQVLNIIVKFLYYVRTNATVITAIRRQLSHTVNSLC